MFRSNSNFDKLLDKATSNLRLDPDWPTILQICDLIRQNDCPPKYAVAAIKKKLTSTNPHQAMFALLVLESIVKNCGAGVHEEIASVANCESYRTLVKQQTHENVRSKILELMQAWAYAFRNIPKYRTVQDAVNILKAEGYKFPTLKESDAMFSADSAPEWFDGDVCHRCRVQFTLMQRKHHCRACGQVFCQQCSAKSTTLPKFGIEKEVRVCDGCYEQVNKPSTMVKPESVEVTYTTAPSAQETPAPKSKTADELREEEELQLAIALSQSEAEHKEKERQRPPAAVNAMPEVSSYPEPGHESPPNSGSPAELSRYLDRNFWEKLAQPNPAQQNEPPSAPTPSPGPAQSTNTPDTAVNKIGLMKIDNNSPPNPEMDEFVSTLKSQVEIFVNRMKSNSSRGRSIANDSSVQTLFMNLTAMHSRLHRYIQQQEDNRVHFEGLQDKLAQVKDSRAALDVLREEHAERLRRAAEQAEIQRQLQMAHKLDVMRKKKQEYLQYQRQLALQRVQEQEREMQMRQEQQKHQYMLSGNNGQFYVQGSPVHQFQNNQPNRPPFGQPFPMMPNLQQQTPHMGIENPNILRQPPSQGTVPNQILQSNIPIQQHSGQHMGHIPQINMPLPGMPQPQGNQGSPMGPLPPGINPGALRQGGPSMPMPHLNQQMGPLQHIPPNHQIPHQIQQAVAQGGHPMMGPVYMDPQMLQMHPNAIRPPAAHIPHVGVNQSSPAGNQPPPLGGVQGENVPPGKRDGTVSPGNADAAPRNVQKNVPPAATAPEESVTAELICFD